MDFILDSIVRQFLINDPPQTLRHSNSFSNHTYATPPLSMPSPKSHIYSTPASDYRDFINPYESTHRFDAANKPTLNRTKSIINMDRMENHANSSHNLANPQPNIYATPSSSTSNNSLNSSKTESLSNCEASTNLIPVSNANRISLRWIDNLNAKDSVIIALTVFYAMIITIFALVFELSHLLAGESRRAITYKDLFFGFYMYGISILFLLYCYIVLLLNPRWYSNFEKAKVFVIIKKNRFSKSSNLSSATTLSLAQQQIDSEANQINCDKNQLRRKISHDSPSAGSLFLRLGCVVFGLIGIVYYAFSVFLCLSDDECLKLSILLDCCAIIFVFTQMHFVFCNWKLSITGSQTIARFGTMHLVAANLWTWIRYILIEESAMNQEIRHVFVRDVDNGIELFTQPTTIQMPLETNCSGAECVLASMSEIMYTSIVEYSLIGAGVMFIVWRNIDNDRVARTYVKRKHQIRMDCSKTTTGLFMGLAYLAATFTSMAVFSGYTLMGKNQLAAIVFGSTDIAQVFLNYKHCFKLQYFVASFACIMALWQMRLLRYCQHNKLQQFLPTEVMQEPTANFNASKIVSTMRISTSGHNPSQQLLDKILLAFGMAGEMIYSVAGLLGLSGDSSWETLTIVLIGVHISRIVQVSLQSCLIYIAGKLRVHGDPVLKEKQPGKQAITFLLLANISMFLMNLLEAEKAGISKAVINFYGRRSWVFLVRSFSPLTIFYRFHSSVCLAEIWKNVYSTKY